MAERSHAHVMKAPATGPVEIIWTDLPGLGGAMAPPKGMLEQAAEDAVRAEGLPPETGAAAVRLVRRRSQVPEMVRLRDRVCLTLRAEGWSYPRIGRALGRDHSTVLAACRRAEARGIGDHG
ncbi:hypothetical protein LNKW23_18140 [Paralimibaculum aggregatum]|uniref:Chromosomal replication initiator DnaA C-terminal domain-containing protein n=1 Tax=Paralimibaculum aggregatum TaxID=3036245 RepID=A0ABQ6LJL6_9RHOB|nr:helix-turn-helix domain-containing protein [Limibaculum sp. NKW23]GMG82601.1 hypothetical protein LNKW23_18140 [Limibaculum sp. NKW23]